MIGRVEFVTIGQPIATIRPQEDYGILLVNYDAPPPEAKTYKVQIEGRSGSIDLTEWAGDVFYEDRPITIRLRDFQGDSDDFITRLNGQRVKIYFDDKPDWYYVGRIESIKNPTRKRIADLTMQIAGDPFKYPRTSDGTGQYSASSVPYSGYYRFSGLVPNGQSITWAFELYQDISYIEMTISAEFNINNEQQNNRSKIVVTGTESVIGQNGTFTLNTPLHKGLNSITIYNNQLNDVVFTASAKFKNRVM